MRGGALILLLSAFAAAPLAPVAAYAGRGDHGYDMIDETWAPPSLPLYAQGYDAPRRPPRPGWYRAEYGPRGDRPPPPPRGRCERDRGSSILGAIAGGLLGGADRGGAPVFAPGGGALADRGC